MDFSEYQKLASQSEQKKGEEGLIISLLGLAGEAGELLSAYKKYLRDGESHQLYSSSITEELGDLLWYLANTATKFNLSLDEIANSNLRKVQSRWLSETDQRPSRASAVPLYDEVYPENEQIPRHFSVRIIETIENSIPVARSYLDGEQIGNGLTDNSYLNDGYRFHDVFHLSYAAILGWSPVFRKNINHKRRSNTTVNEVEDGGRAAAIEEGISALIFAYAKEHNWLKNIRSVDDSLLRTIMGMASHLEVKNRVTAEWERAILKGFDIWRQVVIHSGGEILVDMNSGEIVYLSSQATQP
jgi:NTP pyrophosphatase (non-canonical NTP hydrolase)